MVGAATETAYRAPPPVRRDRVPINATVPALPPPRARCWPGFLGPDAKVSGRRFRVLADDIESVSTRFGSWFHGVRTPTVAGV